jgi:hypothetical protein
MITRKVRYSELAKKLRHLNNKTRTSFYGFYAALFTAFLTLAAFVIALFTPPLSGPFCTGLCLQYPFSDSISRFPRDYYWMYPAILMILAYLVLIICIHVYTPGKKKLFSKVGLVFAILAAVILIADYFIQISVIQASLLHGETEGIAIFSQYNPHGVFIALEEVGLLLMSISFVSIAPVFKGTKRLEKSIRFVLMISFLLTFSAFILISVLYGIHREYRFEVAVITINWTTLIIVGILLSIQFRRKVKKRLEK